MSTKNRRRAAKARQRGRERAREQARPAGTGQEPPLSERFGRLDVRVCTAIYFLKDDPRKAEELAGALLRGAERYGGAPAGVGAEARRQLRQLVRTLTANGWTPHDLGEILRRGPVPASSTLLALELAAHAGGFPGETVAPAWRAQIADLGRCADVDATQPAGLAALLLLASALCALPGIAEVLPPPGKLAAAPAWADVSASAEEARQLARVRALLAKAESTTYDAEAEALTAKARELISRFALERLLTRASSAAGPVGAVAARRIWIDPPYVLAKAALVDAVGSANRVRTVVSDKVGFCTVVGEPRDLDAVELLSTSLLVQAQAAMLRHGRQADGYGTSRTRSFRQSFLHAYAGRIGQRLRESGRAAAADAAAAERLLPVLRAAEEAVTAEYERLFPRTVVRTTSASNAAGWAAGTAAADLASLNVHDEVRAG